MDKHKIDEKDLDFRRDIDPNSLYELTSLLGEGSYGAVYRARSRVKHEEVAIKIIPDADDDLTSLWREIRFLQVIFICRFMRVVCVCMYVLSNNRFHASTHNPNLHYIPIGPPLPLRGVVHREPAVRQRALAGYGVV
ncbi:hypothetical protein EON65_54420 [archaeon]|nr:MAG: hypothetical protein EON65_54420 [archaeon]